MSEFTIRTERIGKAYRIGTQLTHADTLRDRLGELARTATRRTVRTKESGILWALRDVSFEVEHGEVVGIIGANGSGKTTLLKLLSRITEPTEGRALLRGRVGSLLEVGTGFHQELTGRENIFLSGAIIGMRRTEIRHKFDDIAEFSGVGRFIDTPVKRFSSGMYVRLAFAVAAFLEPEILLIDEVLAVGDSEFQKRCIGKMGSVAREGRTVLVVSHNMGVINQLCSRAIWLQRGHVRGDASPAELTRAYLAEGATTDAAAVFELDPSRDTQVVAARLLGPDDELRQRFSCDEPITIEIDFLVRRRTTSLYGNLSVGAADGTPVMISYTYDVDPNPMENLDEGLHTLRAAIPPRTLAPGDYSLDFSVARGHKGTVVLEQGLMLGSFALDDLTTVKGNRRTGYFSTILDWTVSEPAVAARNVS